MTDNDINGLPRLLREITKYIPSINDDDLIKHLKGGVKPVKNFYPSHGGNITDIVNKLAEKETYYRYAKIFITILKYSLLGRLKILLKDVQA